MPAPYSLDLRQKAITALEAGHSKASVSRFMGISTTTLTEWHNRYRASGEVAAKQGYQQGHSHKITDWEAFRRFAASTGTRRRPRWPSCGPRKLAKIRWAGRSSGLASREKKELISTPKETRKNAKPTTLKLAQYEAHQRVYLDEAGINNTEDYAYGWCPKGERFKDLRIDKISKTIIQAVLPISGDRRMNWRATS
jgi:hypothetical protein